MGYHLKGLRSKLRQLGQGIDILIKAELVLLLLLFQVDEDLLLLSTTPSSSFMLEGGEHANGLQTIAEEEDEGIDRLRLTEG